MQARRQLLMWTAVILVLSLILFNKLHDNTVPVVSHANDVDLAQIDLANLFESNVFASQGELREGSSYKNQVKGAATEQVGQQSESPVSRSGSSIASMHMYYVRKHDTLSQISNAYNINLHTLLSVNKLENPHYIRVGQAIKIPTQQGLLYTVQRNDTLEDIALQYGVPLHRIIVANVIPEPHVIQAGITLFIPGATKAVSLRTEMTQQQSASP